MPLSPRPSPLVLGSLGFKQEFFFFFFLIYKLLYWHVQNIQLSLLYFKLYMTKVFVKYIEEERKEGVSKRRK
jgi:hypothetical protein